MIPGIVYSAPALAQEFGVSATPVREAMVDLCSEGLVETVRNKGYRVTEVSDKDLDDITDLRLMIEPSAGRRAVAAVTAEGHSTPARTGRPDRRGRQRRRPHPVRRRGPQLPPDVVGVVRQPANRQDSGRTSCSYPALRAVSTRTGGAAGVVSRRAPHHRGSPRRRRRPGRRRGPGPPHRARPRGVGNGPGVMPAVGNRRTVVPLRGLDDRLQARVGCTLARKMWSQRPASTSALLDAARIRRQSVAEDLREVIDPQRRQPDLDAIPMLSRFLSWRSRRRSS